MPIGEAAARRARIALQRFGLGPKPGGPARIGNSARAAIIAEINNPQRVLISSSSLLNYRVACARSQRDFQTAQAIVEAELLARYHKALQPEIGFVERLVRFWANHFNMSIGKSNTVRGTIGQLERDVIRVHVLGNFRDMLHGVMKHPAMINFLDNQGSIGPRSPYGAQSSKGMNENLGRELLELHTVGVDGGYVQADVEGVAKIITGWSYVRGWESDGGWNGGTPDNRGQFIYRDDWHEIGRQTVMGVHYNNRGFQQGEALLDDLAVHPKTAEHIAFKLVHHFITDTPDPSMVDPVAQAFVSSGGDLRAVALALIDLPAAWHPALRKVRLPDELTIAQMRAYRIGPPPSDESWKWREPLRALKHLPWECPSPAGYPDETAAWISADGMRIRSDTAQLFYQLFGDAMPWRPDALATSLFDDALSAESLASITSGRSRRQAMTALLMTPEFQRR